SRPAREVHMSEAFKEPVFTEVPFRPEPGPALRRAGKRRASPWKGLASGALQTGVAMAVSAVVLLGGWEVAHLAATASVFTVREIRFHGLVHASEKDLLAASHLAPGANLFALDLSAATGAMSANPWVASARLSRHFRGPGEWRSSSHPRPRRAHLAAWTLSTVLGPRSRGPVPAAPRALPLSPGCSRK